MAPRSDSPKTPYGYFRLAAIDGKPLPLALRYSHARCTVFDGDARLSDFRLWDGDGTISIALIGTAFGHPPVRQIFLEREPYDQVDDQHLTFPGGHRRWRRVVRPQCLIRLSDDEFTITPIGRRPARTGLNRVFEEHEWHFVRSDTLLANSDVGANRP